MTFITSVTPSISISLLRNSSPPSSSPPVAWIRNLPGLSLFNLYSFLLSLFPYPWSPISSLCPSHLNHHPSPTASRLVPLFLSFLYSLRHGHPNDGLRRSKSPPRGGIGGRASTVAYDAEMFGDPRQAYGCSQVRVSFDPIPGNSENRVRWQLTMHNELD